MSENGRGRIVVRTNNVLRAPLLDTNEAHLIEFRDQFGTLHALFCRVLSDDMWGLITKSDPEWPDTLIRYGYLKDSTPIEQLIRGT